MSIFGKARAGENLSPAARSFLRLVEGLAVAAIVAALPVVADALSRGAVNWGDVGRTALAAASAAVMLAAVKYAKAHGDAPLPSGASQQPLQSSSQPDSTASATSATSATSVSASMPVSASDASSDPFAPLSFSAMPETSGADAVTANSAPNPA